MSDPFSVAGTAVGICSLGIQSCQIIHNYYSQYKGFHDDVDSVLQQVDSLEGVLKSLYQVKDRFELDNHEPSSQLYVALKTSEEALARLKVMADQCNTMQQPANLETRLRNVKNRLLWPYRKETLVALNGTMSRAQHNLSLALQSAGFDGLGRKMDELHPKLDDIRGQTTSVQRALFDQHVFLEMIYQGVMEVCHTQYRRDDALVQVLSGLHADVAAYDALRCEAVRHVSSPTFPNWPRLIR
jgi:hypothetical protein